KRALLETVAANAREAFATHKLKRASDFDARARGLKELQEALDLPEAPLRIECYDISNLQGSQVVGSMVVFEDGLARKSEYRRFEVRSVEGQDDVASLREVLTRRLARLASERDEPEEAEGSGEPRGGAPVGREGSGEPRGGAPVGREGSGEPQGDAPMTLFEPFTIPYMQRALVEVLVLGALAGAVGVLVVLRRLAFVGDALTHTVFPGVVIAHLLGRSLLLGALAFGVLTAVLLTAVGRHRRVGDDAALAILLTSFFSLGVVLISRTRGFTADLTAFLFGRVLAVDRTDLLQTLVVAAVAAIVLALLHKELVLRAFDPEATAAMGYRTRALDLVLNLLIALVVVAAVEAVGTVLVIALIVVPAAAARLLADRVGAMTALACLLGAAGGWLGLAVSYEVSVDHGVRLAAGATIVVVLVGLFLLAAAVAPLRRRRAAAGGHP
ncbi:MAG TPA: metal ABC transporter permease, partial [Actinomycetes bacterium]|nr:metal ABC transporter permease [Actinomycetes bacterium]